MSIAQQKEPSYMNSTQSNETRIAILEQALIHNTSLLHDIKNRIEEGRKENKEEFNKIWNKVENLDHRINDNYKYLDQKIDSRFSDIDKRFLNLDERFDKIDAKINSNFKVVLGTILGLYATIFGGLIAKFFNFV